MHAHCGQQHTPSAGDQRLVSIVAARLCAAATTSSSTAAPRGRRSTTTNAQGGSWPSGTRAVRHTVTRGLPTGRTVVHSAQVALAVKVGGALSSSPDSSPLSSLKAPCAHAVTNRPRRPSTFSSNAKFNSRCGKRFNGSSMLSTSPTR